MNNLELASDEELEEELIRRYSAKDQACVILRQWKTRDNSGDVVSRTSYTGSYAALGLAECFVHTYKTKDHDRLMKSEEEDEGD